MTASGGGILAGYTVPEAPGDRRYVVRLAGGLTHASPLTEDEAREEARQWRKTGREAVVCELREIPIR